MTLLHNDITKQAPLVCTLLKEMGYRAAVAAVVQILRLSPLETSPLTPARGG